ncbi:MAG: RNA polymerase recycling motor HelD [Eubacteriales bacterium]|nr:RNA polymerase recycling motor HelD [Eubacteriales bacterium]
MAQHPDFPAESAHVAQALVRIAKEEETTAVLEAQQAVAVEDFRRRSGGSFSNEWFIMEKMYDLTCQKLHNLHHAANKPYFARIDFQPDAAPQTQAHYIGKWGVIDAQTQRPYIVDWRAPLANLYYGGQVGPAGYDTPRGRVEGEITRKRIFSIDKGVLKSIVEADIVTEDEYLNDVLSDHADTRLRDIVTTIQAEQNDIIRHDYHRPLVVQGVAGAGKTTVALHRITWLLYTYQQTMSAENLMVIAPTPLFLNYISAVLPELGAENVLQTTFAGLAELLCGVHLPKLDDSGRLLTLLRCDDPEERAQLVTLSRLKGSLLCRDCVQAYASHLESSILPDEDLCIGRAVVMSREELRRCLCEELKPFPLRKRFPQLKKVLKLRISDKLEQLRARLETEVVQKANLLRTQPDSPARRARMQALYQARDEKLVQLEKATDGLADRYLSRIPKLDLMSCYREFLSPEPVFPLPQGVAADLWSRMCAMSLELLDRKRIETADVAPLMLLCQQLNGFAQRLDIHHTVLDESQDFSAFQFDILRELTHNNSFTIVGDLTQGIHGYRGVTNWATMMGEVFGETRADYRELVTSYRNTMEIMTLAGKVAAKFPFAGQQPAKPVLRHGPVPVIAQGGPADIARRVQAHLDAGMKTVAIVEKYPEDCKALYKTLKKQLPQLLLYQDNDQEYQGGVMVIPAHLVKGLEFDAVIVADASAEKYPADELHCRLLYVCLTRPLHELACFYQGALSPLLSDCGDASTDSL